MLPPRFVYLRLSYPSKSSREISCGIALPGAGVKTIKEPKRHIYYAEEGCIRLEMEIHGLNPEMSTEEFKEISSAFETIWLMV